MERSRICKICGKEYPRHPAYSKTQWTYSKYCSYICGALAKKKKAEAKIQPTKICKTCGKIYSKNRAYSQAQWRLSEYCSWICGARPHKKYKNKKEKLKAHREVNRLKKGSAPWGSEEHREKQRQSTLRNMMFRSNGNFPNVQRGEYDINGTIIYFRSKWEANYALYLDFLADHNEIAKWEFEPDKFVFEKIRFGTRSYTPDFKVFNKDGSIEYHEVKGFMDSRSKTKLKRMKRYYPKTVVILIDADSYKLLKKQIGALCKFY